VTDRLRYLDLKLPYPPTLNTGWRCVAGRVVLAARQRAFRKTVGDLVQQLRADRGSPYTTRFGSLALGLSIAVYPPTRRAFDLDNVIKPCLDALMHAGVMDDDSQVIAIEATKGIPDPPKGYAWVVLTEVPGGVPGDTPARARLRIAP
jgi:crossover junction endodeoxyribonuclease RusA